MAKKIFEMVGRGISVADSMEYGMDGSVRADISDDKLKPGRLRIKKTGEAIVPVIIYNDTQEDALCAEFQVKADNGAYEHIDLRSLVCYTRRLAGQYKG